MDLIPQDVRARLLSNGRSPRADHVPLIKQFDRDSASVWLISEMQPYDNDVAFGLYDFGFGTPKVGPFYLSALERLIQEFEHRVRRDPLFVGRHPLSVYHEAAKAQGSITTVPCLLEAAARRLAARRKNDRP